MAPIEFDYPDGLICAQDTVSKLFFVIEKSECEKIYAERRLTENHEFKEIPSGRTITGNKLIFIEHDKKYIHSEEKITIEMNRVYFPVIELKIRQ